MKLENFFLYLYLLLLLLSPFVQSATDLDTAETFSINVLPQFVTQLSGWIRWGIFVISIIVFLLKFREFLKIKKEYLFISAFYCIQFLYSLISLTEVDRYFSLFLFSTTIPFFVYLVLRDNKNAINYSCYIVYFLLISSLLFNYKMIFSGMRFSGFSNNSNLFAVTAIFWLVILLLKEKKSIFHIFIIFLALGEIFLSGSRNGLLGVFLVLFIQYRTNLKVMIMGSIVAMVLLFLLVHFLELHSITDRLLNIGNAAKDSGRDEFWDPAIAIIKQEPFWGHGMDANDRLVGTGNVHNVYLRYILNMGLFFTVLSFIFYFLFLVKTSLQYKIIPGAIIGFLIAFTLNNYGEDFLVGIGSSIFVYFTYIIGFSVYYSNKKCS